MSVDLNESTTNDKEVLIDESGFKKADATNSQQQKSVDDSSNHNDEDDTEDKSAEPSNKPNTTDTSILSTSSASLSPNIKSSSSSSSSSSYHSSSQPNKPFQPLPGLQIAAEWYKQYEDRILSQRSALFAGLSNIKPSPMHNHNTSPVSNQQQQQSSPLQGSNQTTPSSSSAPSSNDSSLLMERFYSQLPQPTVASPFGLKLNDVPADKTQLLLASHQALIAQYAQQIYGNQNGLIPKIFNPSNQNQHESSNHESEKDRYLASLGLYNNMNTSGSYNTGGGHFNLYQRQHQVNGDLISPATPLSNSSSNSNNQFNQMLNRDHNLRAVNNSTNNNTNNSRVNCGNHSSYSRSPSPSSSQLSGNAGCDEEDEDCGDDLDSQSIGVANGEWTYEEQFKQVLIMTGVTGRVVLNIYFL